MFASSEVRTAVAIYNNMRRILAYIHYNIITFKHVGVVKLLDNKTCRFLQNLFMYTHK